MDLTIDNHSDKPTSLSGLGNTFLIRFLHTGNLVDLDGSIAAHQEAVNLTPDGHAGKPMLLNNLGSVYLHHYGSSQKLADG